MTLSHNSRCIADISLNTVVLEATAGGYEIRFPVTLKLYEAEPPYWFRVESVQVSVSGQGRQQQKLVTVRPDDARTLQTYRQSSSSGIDLSAPLSGQQVAAIEALRTGGDLTFRLAFRGESIHEGERAPLFDDCTLPVPASAWIEQLKRSGFSDVLLIEIPFPPFDLPPALSKVRVEIEEAQRHYVRAEYRACVGSCRTAMQELGHHLHGDENWHSGLNGKKPREMTKDERARAIFAAIRNFTHLAHHGDSEGGTAEFTRSEAQMMLRMCAAAVSGMLT